MAITKTNFINYTRCPKYIALDDLRKDKLTSAISYEEYKNEELEEQKRELLSGMFEDEEYEVDLTKDINPQMQAMMPYYKQVEIEAGLITGKYFKGLNIYAEKTQDQQLFECIINNVKYMCYVDIYNELDDNINIIEVKATTTKKYEELMAGFKGQEKYSIFYKINNILHLKDEIPGYNLANEMDFEDYKKKRNKLFDRYSDVGGYVFDLAVQRYIIEHDYKQNNNEQAINKTKYYLAVLNTNYVYDGSGEYHEVDGEELITFIDLTKVTEEYQERVDIYRKSLELYMDKSDAKKCPLGIWCCRKKSKECIYFKTVCGKDIPAKNSVFNYLNCHMFKDDTGQNHECIDLVNDGYLSMMDIPASWIKSKKHEIQRDCYSFDRVYIDKEKIIAGINTLKYPIYHLDFETFPCPLPRFWGEKPYTQSPFEFSLHIEREPGKCDKDKDNYVFLAKTFGDERKAMAKALVEHIDGSKGTMFAQNYSFEKACLKNLATLFPEYADRLLKIRENSADLLWLVNTNKELYTSLGFDKERAALPNYYNKNLSGSYSIKKTLPVFSDLSYANLDVKNGMEAILAYSLYPSMSKEEYNLKYDALVTYCKQDTWAMVVILQALRELVK